MQAGAAHGTLLPPAGATAPAMWGGAAARALRAAGGALRRRGGGLRPPADAPVRWCRAAAGGGSGGGGAAAAAAAAAPAGAPPAPAPAAAAPPPPPSSAYPFAAIEARWQAHWDAHATFRTPAFADLDTSKPKFYALDMFPYPSGSGLHVGHPEGYTATDIVARYKRHAGFNVLHPMGWDAFGLPAEQYAIQTGAHPADTTAANIARFRRQLKALGFSYDWGRELSTADPGYYRWTQWCFLKLLRAGLAYRAEVPVNWCPALGTVLANEEVINGLSERGGHPVERRPMRQWMLAITRYADRLLEGLDGLEWDEPIKEMQRNWIGRSEGAAITFELHGGPGAALPPGAALEVFTTRPDTLLGATYVVVAPEHPLLPALACADAAPAVAAYAAAAAAKSDLERQEGGPRAAKSGVWTGSWAAHPATGEPLPVWVADYVLGSYGSGAVMAVPAHDARDWEFAAAHGLPVVRVVEPPGGGGGGSNGASPPSPGDLPFTGEGVAVGPGAGGLELAGLPTPAAKAAAIAWLEARGAGSRRVAYRLRDWLFARQRYWGEPFPVVYPGGDEAGPPVPLPEAELPLVLPPCDDFRPSGTPEPPLARCREWVAARDPATGARTATRETSTMPQWAGSCWYYLRFIDPGNDAALVDPAAERYWMPVDLYVGGAEHATLHLLYARFWHKALHDAGAVSTPEPFARLVSQGMILGEVEYTAWRDAATGEWAAEGAPGAAPVRLAPADVEPAPGGGGGHALRGRPDVPVSARAHKMSKSRGNVVNPDEVVRRYGADSLRLYEMFMGPLRDTKVWSTQNVEGVHRFLARCYRLVCGAGGGGGADGGAAGGRGAPGVVDAAPTREQARALHECIRRVTEDTEALRFNTAIAAMMELVNAAYRWGGPGACPRAVAEPLALLLSPYAPHLAEELWAALGHAGSLAYAPWPAWDAELLRDDAYTLAVQVNGKTRGAVDVPVGAGEAAAVAAARALPAVARQLGDQEPRKVIFVPGKILNLIVPK